MYAQNCLNIRTTLLNFEIHNFCLQVRNFWLHPGFCFQKIRTPKKISPKIAYNISGSRQKFAPENLRTPKNISSKIAYDICGSAFDFSPKIGFSQGGDFKYFAWHLAIENFTEAYKTKANSSCIWSYDAMV